MVIEIVESIIMMVQLTHNVYTDNNCCIVTPALHYTTPALLVSATLDTYKFDKRNFNANTRTASYLCIATMSKQLRYSSAGFI